MLSLPSRAHCNSSRRLTSSVLRGESPLHQLDELYCLHKPSMSLLNTFCETAGMLVYFTGIFLPYISGNLQLTHTQKRRGRLCTFLLNKPLVSLPSSVGTFWVSSSGCKNSGTVSRITLEQKPERKLLPSIPPNKTREKRDICFLPLLRSLLRVSSLPHLEIKTMSVKQSTWKAENGVRKIIRGFFDFRSTTRVRYHIAVCVLLACNVEQ